MCLVAVCKVALSAYTYSLRANEVDQTPGQEAWSIPHYRGVAAYMNTKNAALERVHEASGGLRSLCVGNEGCNVPREGVIAIALDGKVKRRRGPLPTRAYDPPRGAARHKNECKNEQENSFVHRIAVAGVVSRANNSRGVCVVRRYAARGSPGVIISGNPGALLPIPLTCMPS